MDNAAFRELPGIEKLVASPSLKEWDTRLIHAVRVRLAQELVAALRDRIKKGGKCPGPSEIEAELLGRYREIADLGMRKVINATGVVLHTNLGRAPSGAAVMGDMARELDGYCTLEFNTSTGERGSRGAAIERLVKLLVDTEAAIVVNNNAAAVFLILHTLARGKATLISRGELVQIGGGFRVPDILAASGSELIEVGTTNMTSVKDFQKRLGPGHGVGCVLKVHQSNFVIQGHVEEPKLDELAKVARGAQVPLVVDLGSGALIDEGIQEPTVGDILRGGASVVSFSGDKLLGGPQAGIIVGDAALVARMKESPLYRALRPGKAELFLLEQCLKGYARGAPNETQKGIRATEAELKARAERIRGEIATKVPDAKVVRGTSSIGGGTTPALELPTWLVEMAPADTEALVKRLLRARPAVVVRKENKKVLLDPRTVFPEEEIVLARLITENY